VRQAEAHQGPPEAQLDERHGLLHVLAEAVLLGVLDRVLDHFEVVGGDFVQGHVLLVGVGHGFTAFRQSCSVFTVTMIELRDDPSTSTTSSVSRHSEHRAKIMTSFFFSITSSY